LKIAVIGAGIVGVTTAYELVADGHEVTVPSSATGRLPKRPASPTQA
jgi:glycine/D-amino acid oxidase-like deaminating enzyme